MLVENAHPEIGDKLETNYILAIFFILTGWGNIIV
jgi:hypothetical protein